MIAVTIDDVIEFAAQDIATVSYDGVLSLYTQTGLWITGMFSQATGIYPPSEDAQRNPGQRPVSDWFANHLMAQSAIEGTTPGSSGIVGTAAVIDAVTRVASAVKYATLNGYVSAGQQNALIALYNVVWA